MKLTKIILAPILFATTAAAPDQDNRNGYRQGVATDSVEPKNGQADREYDIDITGEASYYNAAEETFDFCDVKTEETCYYHDDGGSLNYYCAALVDGGCVCPAGYKKCDAFPLTGVASFCAMACCDSRTEETCYDYDDDGNFNTQYCAPLAKGGCACPEGLEKCEGDPLNGIASYCNTICCDHTLEETCYDYDEEGKVNQYCAAFAEGGCPCPQGQEKCGADPLNGVAGYCAAVCCDINREEMCLDYDENGYMIQYCAAVADGGCPCPEGEKKCQDTLNDGESYCALVCCDVSKEETCTDYDDDGNMKQYCAALSDGGCPCPIGQMKCDADPWTGVTSYCAMVCCNSSEETCSFYDKGGNLKQYCALLADGGCRDMGSDDYSVNTTHYGGTSSITEYDEEEVAEILHAMM